MPRRYLVVALLLALADGVLIFQVSRVLTAAQPLPASPPPRVSKAGPPVPKGEAAPAPVPPLTTFGNVATKNLFHVDRREAPPPQQAAPLVPPAPKPRLFGVVKTGGGDIAYLEDPTTKKVHGYRVGDQIAGGQVNIIEDDRVKIQRGVETIEVLLRDPAKAQAVAAPGPRPSLPPALRPGSPTPPTAPRPTPLRRLPPRPGVPQG